MNLYYRVLRLSKQDFLKLSSYLVFIALFLILLPPLKIPFIDISFINSVFIGRLFVLTSFALLVLRMFFKGDLAFAQRTLYIDVVVLFFVFQSLSIVNAVSPIPFIKGYEKVIFGLVFFLVAVILDKEKTRDLIRNTLLLLFIAGIFRLALELALYFYPEPFLTLANYLFKAEVVTSIKANLFRNRTYIDLTQEALFPVFIYFSYKPRLAKKIKYLSIAGAILLGFVAFLSNWRGRVVALLAIIPFTLVVLHKAVRKHLAVALIIGAVVVSGLALLDQLGQSAQGFTVVDRFLNRSQFEDAGTIKWRLAVFRESIDMGLKFPFGVGIKNFYDWTSQKGKSQFVIREFDILTEEAAQDGPHNIFFQFFAETGVPGFLVFLVMLAVFAKNDLKIIRKENNQEGLVLALVSWGLIIVTLFYPATSLSFYAGFFFLRGLLKVQST